MAKIKPWPAAGLLSPAGSSSDDNDECCQSSQGAVEQQQQAAAAEYTVWMKSLVFNGNGCTVYGADGRVAYRVDNYGCRGGREVFFMDRAGSNLIRIQRKSFFMFRRWEACRCFDDGEGEEARPWFRVHKTWKQDDGCAAVVTMHGSGRTYRIEGCARKSDYRILSADDGAIMAAVGRKRTSAGVVLGEDVLALTVGSATDHLLALGLVVVCGLMSRRL
ncbi:protein LURP-one-related 11 [Sorghum bicolor]|uniref:Protein LURP-one-related 11 n=1 Tax=Sorghum bicolor TaxID=4558 RepID=C5XH24_SORBI|nr:protein LURP-one-related 11 [Sorghum bicolor]EES04155.1 hypothetical protein SORBI_3003G414700 [Sorghum bicolor]|eukprot:XP_002459035.1 protein LURP-one-related 11 [Sorghum bicolor]